MKHIISTLLIVISSAGCSTISGAYTDKMSKNSDISIEVLAAGHHFKSLQSDEKLFKSQQQLVAWSRENKEVAAAVMATAGIDFKTHHLIYVAAGMKPHAGYQLGLSNGAFSHRSGAARLRLRLEQPAPNDWFSSKLASPYVLLKVPAGRYRSVNIEYEACDQRQTLWVGR